MNHSQGAIDFAAVERKTLGERVGISATTVVHTILAVVILGAFLATIYFMNVAQHVHSH